MILRPPPLESLPRGAVLYAGLGTAMVLPDFDFETYSEAGYVWDGQKWQGPPGAPKGQKGLGVVGAAVYAAHPSTRVLSLAYDLKDGLGKRYWRPGLPFPHDLFAYLASGGLVEAWNVAFERWIWELVCVPRMGWPPIHPRQYRCAMAKSRTAALPGSLDKAGDVLQLTVRKDDDGKRLLKKFSVPHDPSASDPRLRYDPIWTRQDLALAYQQSTGKPTLRTLNADHEDSLKLLSYNVTDIATEAEASSRIPDLLPEELAWWFVHEDVNHRGVCMDRKAIEDCIAVISQAHGRYHAELAAITGIDSASKVAQLQDWLRARSVFLDSLDEEAVEEALTKLQLTPECRRVLEIRAAVGSASVKKVFSMRNRLCWDDRMRDLFIFAGARTGRSTGEGPQPLNSPKAGPDLHLCACGRHHGGHCTACPWCGLPVPPGKKLVEWSPQAAEDALAVIAYRDLSLLESVMGDALQMMAGCLRGLYIAGPGNDFICSDYNSIEAIGLAMLSGEQWRIDVFKTHGKIYEASAATMYGLTLEEILQYKKDHGTHHPLRGKGKIAELAFGYGGWLGSAKAFGMPGTDDEIKRDILGWRKASPCVEWLWGGQTKGKADGVRLNAGIISYADRWDSTPEYFGVEGAAVQAILNPGVEFPVLRLDGTHCGVTYVMRGDALYCTLPSGRPLTYHAPRLQSGDRGGLEMSYEGWNSNAKNGPFGWIRMRTWGSRLVENINQAACADFMRHACINLEAANYPVVLHIYDEIVSEVPEGYGSHKEFEAIMERRPSWAADWPIRAPGSWRGKRYRKG